MAAVITYVFRLKPKSGSIMAGVLQNAYDQREAERKIEAKYPGVIILEVKAR